MTQPDNQPSARPDEPGWGVIVEAGVRQHGIRSHWMRMSGSRSRWNCDDELEYDREWADLVDPVVPNVPVDVVARELLTRGCLDREATEADVRSRLAVAEARAADLEAEVVSERENSCLAADLEVDVARLECNWKAAEADCKDWQNRAEAAEAALARVEALADDGKRHLVRWIDDSHLVDVSDLRTALASAAPAVSDGEGASGEARTSTRVIARAASEGHCTSHVEFTPSCHWCGIARDNLARATASPVVAPSALASAAPAVTATDEDGGQR